MLTALAGRAGR